MRCSYSVFYIIVIRMLGAKQDLRNPQIALSMHGFVLYTTIHSLPAQAMDCTVRRAQRMDLRKAWICVATVAFHI